MRIALAQLCSTRDVEANLATCRQLAARAADGGAHWILYPENAPYLGRDRDKLEVAQGEEGPLVDPFRELAREHGLWVTRGSYPERSDDPGRTQNTQLLIDPDGHITARYRKIHLFDVDLEGGISYCESDSIKPGTEPVVASVEADGHHWQVGLTVCYDLRFPELYRLLVDQGAEILTVPSAFTAQTGPHHWHPLLQARAIENQCYVLAPGQWGNHFGTRASFGQSAAYDPWGRRLACAPDREDVVMAELDHGWLQEVRRRIPCLAHRRL